MTVDSFKFLPRLIAFFYQTTDRQPDYPIPWTPLNKPLAESKFGLVTSAGLYHQEVQQPFDLAREQRQPSWGDPTYRVLPTDLPKDRIGVSHLHLNTRDIAADPNIVLPIDRFQELVKEGRIGGLAKRSFSFMGYQGYPPDPSPWEDVYGPEVSQMLLEDGVDCVLLTPA
jgi:D-proline reductase (dithiol) PrdB